MRVALAGALYRASRGGREVCHQERSKLKQTNLNFSISNSRRSERFEGREGLDMILRGFGVVAVNVSLR